MVHIGSPWQSPQVKNHNVVMSNLRLVPFYQLIWVAFVVIGLNACLPRGEGNDADLNPTNFALEFEDPDPA